MKKGTRQRTGGVAQALAAGIGAAVGMTFLLTAVFAYIMDAQLLKESAAPYAAVVILLLSACVGALVTAWLYPQRRMLLCLGTGGGYLLFLLCMAALFFHGDLRGFLLTAAVVCGGTEEPGCMAKPCTFPPGLVSVISPPMIWSL